MHPGLVEIATFSTACPPVNEASYDCGVHVAGLLSLFQGGREMVMPTVLMN